MNIADARAYAKKYYKNYNPSYPEYSQDCTNFVSQILNAGGKSKVVSNSNAKLVSDNKYWYIKSLPKGGKGRSASWTVVPDLYSHLTRKQKGYSSTSKSSIISNAKAGDVIQFKRSDSKRYTHSMWVYSKSSDNLKLSGHTDNHLERSFNAIKGYKTYRIVKM
ncbi:amidase domain-containing protein [Peribacillus sp. TH27]|uniref:amidase domain-containing protein n=1 Tax=Peribacillus sp. TH27 TaxID=2798484 RepID=UPI001911560F|nr:amidase domain-containing protein [Peribacillus sp. TH27]